MGLSSFNHWFLDILYIASCLFGIGNHSSILNLDQEWSKETVRFKQWGKNKNDR